MINGCLGYDGRAKFDVRHTNYKSLSLLRGKVVNCAHDLFAVLSTNFDDGKSLLFPGLLCETPFILKPWFLRLFNDESDFGRIGPGRVLPCEQTPHRKPK